MLDYAIDARTTLGFNLVSDSTTIQDLGHQTNLARPVTNPL